MERTLDLFLKQILQLFFPDIHDAIDWSRGYENLDAELHEIIRDAELGKTLADKLFRVYLLTGQELRLLIHLEVQSQPDNEFPARMFVYHYRIWDRYDQPVVNLAILVDDRPNWRPTEYLRETFGCEVRLRFRTIKLLDWATRDEELAANSNPIAIIVRAHLHSLLTHGDVTARYGSKSGLLRQLLDRGLEPERIRQIYRLIDWLLDLPEELQERLRIEIHKYAEDKQMPFVTSFERLAKEEQVKEDLETVLEIRFGEPGREFARSLDLILDRSILKEIFRTAITAAKIDELRALVK
jgi:hypothetical protein